MPNLLVNGPEGGATIVLAHGAGAPMDSPFMDAIAIGLGDAGLRVARFEFPYMAARRGSPPARRPPDRESVLLATWRSVVADLGHPRDLVIGGKSMGGRMASMLADELGVRGLVCLGYPFHAPGRPERPRVAHLRTMHTPTLILQGMRDPFGRPDEISGYGLSPAVTVYWLPDGDHDLVPRASSGRSAAANWQDAVEKTAAFVERSRSSR